MFPTISVHIVTGSLSFLIICGGGFLISLGRFSGILRVGTRLLYLRQEGTNNDDEWGQPGSQIVHVSVNFPEDAKPAKFKADLVVAGEVEEEKEFEWVVHVERHILADQCY